MLLEFLVLGIVFGWLRGGRLSRVVDFPIRLSSLILIAFAVQILIARFLGVLDWPRAIGFAILLASFLVLISVLVYNYVIKNGVPMLIMAAGLFLNFAVIALNGGMPVSVELTERYASPDALARLLDSDSLLHIPLTPGTRLSFLGDVVPLPPPYPQSGIISIGDIILALGVFLFVQAAMVYQGKRRTVDGSLPKAKSAT